MFVGFRIVLLAGAPIICAGSLLIHILRLRGCDRPLPAWTDELCDPGIIRECAERRKRQLFFELIRVAVDFCICQFVLLPRIYFSWFHLFPESIGGFFIGFSLLISLTLLASIAVDWLQLRVFDRSALRQRRERLHFFNQEMLSILLIEIGMNVVLACIRGMETLHAGVPLTVILSLLALLAYRAALLLLKNTKRQLRELPESEINSRLKSLLAMEGYPIQGILVRKGGNDSASYGVVLYGLRNRRLLLDRGLLCTLREDEICAAVMHCLEMERQRRRLREMLFRGMQGEAIAVSLVVLLEHIEACGPLGEAAPAGVPEVMQLLVPLAGCLAALQLLRGLGMKWMMMAADRAVIAKGYGRQLRNALIQASGLEMLNPDPAYELLMNHPVFLARRIDKMDRIIRAEEGEEKNEQV